MRYILKDYQDEAVRKILENLLEAKNYLSLGVNTSFALTAPTGAGKTVISAAVIEALLKGNEYFERDKNATILWFSDSPDLNRQSKHRIQAACPEIFESMKEIDNTFSLDSLESGKAYFINTQKFGSQSNLVRKEDKKRTKYGTEQIFSVPDRNTSDIWEVIKNTIEDPEKNLYFFIDEAHRGTGTKVKDYDTILKRIIKGHETSYGVEVPPMPIIFGISATPERFNDMMSKMEDKRLTLGNVNIDAEKVQDSGLLKDVISLSIPDEDGDYTATFLRDGVKRLKEISSAWEKYCLKEDIDIVNPVMVVQTKNLTSKDPKARAAQEVKQLTEYVNNIRSQWPEIREDAFVNVYGEHKDIETSTGINVRYVSPETIQDDNSIRVVFAKEAISTGWDCPRAEVLVSFRAANDKTAIAQILGRMVRTPLSRRIDGDEILNSTTCILPNFNKTNVIEVVNNLSREKIKGKESKNDEDTGGGAGRKVVVNSINLFHNKHLVLPLSTKENDNIDTLNEEQQHIESIELSENIESGKNTDDSVIAKVLESMKTLPTYSLPKKQNSPIVRAINMATELGKDKINENAQKEVKNKLYKVIDGAIIEFDEQMKNNIDDIQKISINYIDYTLESGGIIENFNDLMASDEEIEIAYQIAERKLKPILTKGYIKLKVDEQLATGEYEIDEASELLIEQKLQIAALSRIDEAVERINNEANKIARDLRDKYKKSIVSLSDERKGVYEILDNMSNDPVENNLQAPTTMTASAQKVVNNTFVDVPTYKKHILSDGSGDFPVSLNNWEKKVLSVEEQAHNFIGWYRNPSTGGNASLMIPYEEKEKGEDKTSIMRPDFIFFSETSDGRVMPSIVDPHGDHLADSIDKLQGLAKYAEKHGDDYLRIESVINAGTDKNPEFKVLDLKDEKSRKKVFDHIENDVKSLYVDNYM